MNRTFTEGIAIHGNPSVPVYPASHGCIRIPMFAAKEFSQMTPVGTPVIVYDELSDQELSMNLSDFSGFAFAAESWRAKKRFSLAGFPRSVQPHEGTGNILSQLVARSRI